MKPPYMIKIGAERIVYNGVCLTDYYDVTAYTTKPFPDVELKTVKIPGRAGTKFLRAEIGERDIILKMSLKGFERNPMKIHQLWRDFTPLLVMDEPKPMFFDDDKFINVIVTSASEIERLEKRGISDVTFHACDPYFYGQREQVVQLATGDNSFFIYGQTEIWPMLEITGVTGALTVTDSATGDLVKVPNVPSAEDVLIIDMERQRCTIDDAYVPVDLDSTDFFSLPQGKAEINLSAGTGTLKYRERYR